MSHLLDKTLALVDFGKKTSKTHFEMFILLSICVCRRGSYEVLKVLEVLEFDFLKLKAWKTPSKIAIF